MSCRTGRAPWGLDDGPIEQLVDRRRTRQGRHLPSEQRDRHRVGSADDPARRHDGAASAVPPEDLQRRGGLASAVLQPDAGSDLANLATRAVRDGDQHVISGSKIWSSGAHHSQFGILIARTDPDQPKHKGIVLHHADGRDGLTMTPIVDMTTAALVQPGVLRQRAHSAENLVGAEGDGWRLAKVTLVERAGVVVVGRDRCGVPARLPSNLLDRDPGRRRLEDAVLRDEAAGLHIEAELLRLNRFRSLSATLQGKTPGPEASIQKIMADDHGQRVLALAKALAGADGMLEGSGPAGPVPGSMQADRPRTTPGSRRLQLPDVDPIWHYGYPFSPASTLGGGTSAVQRNIVAEHVVPGRRRSRCRAWPDVVRGEEAGRLTSAIITSSWMAPIRFATRRYGRLTAHMSLPWSASESLP